MTRGLVNARDALTDTFCREESVFTRRWGWTQLVRGMDLEDFARSVLWDFTC